MPQDGKGNGRRTKDDKPNWKAINKYVPKGFGIALNSSFSATSTEAYFQVATLHIELFSADSFPARPMKKKKKNNQNFSIIFLNGKRRPAVYVGDIHHIKVQSSQINLKA